MNEPEIPDGQLIALARQLGVQAAARVDPEGTAAAVLERLRQKPEVRRSWQPAWLAIAAALVLLLGGRVMLREVAHRDSTTAGVAPVAVDVSGLSAHQLGEVLQGLDQTDVTTVDDDTSSVESGIEQLTPAELRSLLSSLTS